MKEIVILSGKGGTGKTSVTASLAQLSAQHEPPLHLVITDGDVDASNLAIVAAPRTLKREEFIGGAVAVIQQVECIQCETCREVCRYDAVMKKGGRVVVDPILCEGCAACVFQCPREAISLHEQVAGAWIQAVTKWGPLFHATLFPAQENSGKLVSLVKEKARSWAKEHSTDLLLVDGPPGIGCPVIAAVSGADHTLIITEPTVSGLSDLRRAQETARHFGVPSSVCINKVDINPHGRRELQEYCQQQGIEVWAEIPFDNHVTRAMVQGKPVTGAYPASPAATAIQSLWEKLLLLLEEY